MGGCGEERPVAAGPDWIRRLATQQKMRPDCSQIRIGFCWMGWMDPILDGHGFLVEDVNKETLKSEF